MTSLSVLLGYNSLIQLGVSLGDIALLVNWGKKFGNFLQAANHDNDLLQILGENPEHLLQRRGVVEVTRMKCLWPNLSFVHKGEKKGSEGKDIKAEQEMGAFSWMMVAVVTVLDLCLRETDVLELLVGLFAAVLERRGEVEESLRIMLPTNINSWRSVGRTRKMVNVVSRKYLQVRKRHIQADIIPQLNQAECGEVTEFLTWLMARSSNTFFASAVDTYAIASAIQSAGILLKTEGQRRYEAEPLVTFRSDTFGLFDGNNSSNIVDFRVPAQLSEDIDLFEITFPQARQISYPYHNPKSMIQSVEAGRHVLNEMEMLWDLGAKAAMKFSLEAEADLPVTSTSEIFYRLEGEDLASRRYDSALSMFAAHGFPTTSGSILDALDKLVEGIDHHGRDWLYTHTASEYLRTGRIDWREKLHRDDPMLPSRSLKNIEVWMKYQALVSGFYYQLLQPLVCFDLLEKLTYFRGLWGLGSTIFLSMCTDFGEALRREGRVSRAQVLYMLSSMFNGRQKQYIRGQQSYGLIGILGSISVVSMSLVRAVDNPSEIGRFMVLDLPCIDLAAPSDGELYAGNSIGCKFISEPSEVPQDIVPHGPLEKWSIHAKMGTAFQGCQGGIVMAARCGGRLVGWFNPLAADVLFLSTAFVKSFKGEKNTGEQVVKGFEITDVQWQTGKIPSPRKLDEHPDWPPLWIVHSVDCPALRYAAAGFFGTAGEEVSISTGDIEAAMGRIELQGPGVIIA
jgi:hypothetical protein